MKIFDYIPLPALIAALVAMVNILTTVTKRVIEVKKAERVVVAWAMGLSIATSLVSVVLEGWTNWVALVITSGVGLILGAVVAYVAMFGYDELYEDALAFISKGIGYLKTKDGGHDAEQP